MKKSTKILGSVALSAALVMGTAAPAFANIGTPYDQYKTYAGVDEDTNEIQLSNGAPGTGSTLVNISTYTSQISVTVPVKVSFALDTIGGPGYAPNNGVYKIINNTKVPVYVHKAAVAESGTANLEIAGSAFSNNPSAYTGSKNGAIYAVFAPGDKTEGATAENSMYISTATADVAKNNNLGWILPAATGESAATYKLTKTNGDEITFASAKSNADGLAMGDIIGADFAAAIKAATGNDWDSVANIDTFLGTGTGKTGGSATLAKTEPTTGSGSHIGFNITVSSSPLKSDMANVQAATITYTVGVTAQATPSETPSED